ncbi:DNA cytosine methyltransferase [Methyloglobulus sp.]|uniref:DNA cytosine methyltransferase n=1 Tax=Methyloglobulus sp. TaxID=2518622 RepID=UPI0032B7F60B
MDKNRPMIKFIDLFAGTGGIRLGFESVCQKFGLKTECVFSSEIDKNACASYELNFGYNPFSDVTKVEKLPPFDFMLAGFPCQSFSYAGKRRGFGETRGTLFFEVERLLTKYKPKGFLLENVRGLTTHDQGRTFETIIQSLKNIGYSVDHFLLNSSNFDVPQNRVRIYIVGILNAPINMTLQSDLGAPDSHKFKERNDQLSIFSEPKTSKVVKDILENDVPEKYECTEEFMSKLRKVVGDDLSKLHGYRLIDYRGGQSIHSWELGIISSLIEKGYLSAYDNKYNPVAGNMSFEIFKFLDPESISITLTASDTNRLGIIQNGKARKLTPRECARLQGFPDSYKLLDNDKAAYKQMGNAVSVPVIEAVVADLIENNNVFDRAIIWPAIKHPKYLVR